MATVKITNTTQGDIGLAPGVAIPAGGSLDVKSETLDGCKGSKVVAHYFKSGMLTNPAKKPAKAAPKGDK